MKYAAIKRDTRTLIALLVVAAVIMTFVSQWSKGTSLRTYNNHVEVTYKADSPLGALGGYVLPASCESGAWNANSNYHLDGTQSDPGNCAATPKQANQPPVMTRLDGSTRVEVNKNVGAWEAKGMDPDGDNIYYEVRWGDGQTGQTNVVRTDTIASLGHIFTQAGKYTISARAIETNDTVAFKWRNLFTNRAIAAAEGLQSGWLTWEVDVFNPAVNNPPERPVISGDLWGIINQTTSNWIVSTDPEGDNIFYELDWDCNGTIDGTTATQASGFNTPIGHIYTTTGTKTICGYAVQANDTAKRSPEGRYTIRITADSTCTAPANACGITNGTIVNGQCVAADLPAGYGNNCSSAANACGMTNNNGTINCSGQCVGATAPSNTSCPCTSGGNICGMTNSGNLNAAGLCTAVTPADALCVVPGDGTTINSFSASPKLVALGKTSKLYWDVAGNRNGCRITYTTNTNTSPVAALNRLDTPSGQVDTTSVTEKRYYKLTCGDKQAEAIVSVFSLTEI